MKIKELMERYNLKTRQSLYNRINHLDLSLPKDDRGSARATPEQIELLDQLHDHLQQPGATMDSFTPISSAVIDDVQSPLDSVQSSLDTTGETGMMLELVGLLAQRMQQPRSPLWYHEELEKACSASWLITTSEVAELIGVKPHGDLFERGCWRFVREGKIGAQTGWRVEKG